MKEEVRSIFANKQMKTLIGCERRTKTEKTVISGIRKGSGIDPCLDSETDVGEWNVWNR